MKWCYATETTLAPPCCHYGNGRGGTLDPRSNQVVLSAAKLRTGEDGSPWTSELEERSVIRETGGRPGFHSGPDIFLERLLYQNLRAPRTVPRLRVAVKAGFGFLWAEGYLRQTVLSQYPADFPKPPLLFLERDMFHRNDWSGDTQRLSDYPQGIFQHPVHTRVPRIDYHASHYV